MLQVFQVLLLASAVLLDAAAGQSQSATVLSITFEGNKTIEAAKLKANMRFCREGAVFQPGALDEDVRRIGALYDRGGYLRAKVGPASVRMETVPGRGQGAFIRIPVEEGPQFLLGEVSIRNAQVLKSASLLQMLPIRTGQPYSREQMSQWRDKILESYQSMGYIRAQAEFREEVRDVRRVVDCTLECKEGNPYRVRSITVEGDPSINRADFKRHLLVGEGSVYNPEMLSYSLHFLNEMRVFNPISQADVDVKIDDTASVVDLAFRVSLLKKAAPSM
jgi:outer membrane protein insertion porin family